MSNKKISEMQIGITAKLYKCRTAAKALLGKDYKKVLKDYKDIILSVMVHENCDELKALLEISKTNAFKESPYSQVLFYAAAVEMIEPSITPTP